MFMIQVKNQHYIFFIRLLYKKMFCTGTQFDFVRSFPYFYFYIKSQKSHAKKWKVIYPLPISYSVIFFYVFVHRPAPPVPADNASPLTSRKANPAGDDTTSENMIEVLDSESISIGASKRRKVKHPMSRRTLRQRKIHSLKRQIQIKEKMLEVTHLIH